MKTTFKTMTGFEKHGPLEFTLHLSAPLLTVPESLYAYNAPMLHRRFDEEGGNWPKNPIGTGPFELTDYAVAQHCNFKRREGYWGKPAYLDGIEYINIGSDYQAQLAALVAGQVDVALSHRRLRARPRRASCPTSSSCAARPPTRSAFA